MQTRPLGNTDLNLSVIGLGTWAIGGGDWAFGWGDQDDDQAIAAIRKAVYVGINWIDTAAVYGLGKSETLVGKALSEIPQSDRPLIATKCGRTNAGNGQIGKSLQRESVIAECEASLRRLQALDQLQSAAQAFVADARAAEACLLLQSSDRWHQPGSDCVHADPDRLRQGWVNDQRWQLLAWRADHDRGQLDLSLADGRAARFYLQLDSASPSVVAVSQPQLLGRAQAGGAS